MLHREKSKESHFQMNFMEAPIADQTTLEQFYPVPDLPNITLRQLLQERSYKIWNYQYNSEIQIEDDQNTFSTGLFYENQANNSPMHVIFVHGWRMDDFKKIEDIFLEPVKRLGYHMYFSTLPYHHKRAPAHSLYNGELMISANIDRTLLAVKQAITDLRALIHWIKKIEADKSS